MLPPLATVAALFATRAHKHDDEVVLPQSKRRKTDHLSAALGVDAICHDDTRAPRLTARERVGLLSHVVLGVSAFLDVALAPRWTIPRACERGYLAMLSRLASREPTEMNEHYRAHLSSKGLVRAAQRGDLPIVQWLCCEYCLSAFAWKGMEAAAVAGQLPVLQWLSARYDYMQWDDESLTSIASFGHLDVL